MRVEHDSGLGVDMKTGYDLDLNAGYDFGMFRLEGELGYKRFRTDNVTISAPPASGLVSGDSASETRGRRTGFRPS